jgi:hypothetical protein
MVRIKIFLFAAIMILSISCNLSGAAIPPTPTSVPVPTQTQGPQPGSITGVVWHEVCKFTGGEGGQPVVLGQGCVQWGPNIDDFGPNQKQDDFETGWSGVTLHLGAGECPSTGLMTAITDSTGKYQFEGIKPGKYCVSYSNTADGNDKILIPGGPVFPARGDEGFATTVDLTSGENKTINFGYAWQFYN